MLKLLFAQFGAERGLAMIEHETVQEEEDDEDDDDEDDDENDVSGDETQTSGKRTIIYMDNKGLKSSQVSKRDRWIVKGVDVSKLLMKQRRKSVRSADRKLRLRDERIMQLNFEFVFRLDTMRELYRLPISIIPDMTEELKVDLVEVPEHLVNWCQSLKVMIHKRQFQEARIKLHTIEGEALASNNEHQMQFSSILGKLCPKFPAWQSKPSTENTYINQNLLSFLEVLFSEDPRFTYALTHRPLQSGSPSSSRTNSLAIAELPSSSAATTSISSDHVTKKRKISTGERVMPDYLSIYKLDNKEYELFTIEVKKHDAVITQFLSDECKVSQEMRRMMDYLVYQGIPSPVVTGLALDGMDCRCYYMDIQHDGIYRFVQFSFFNSMRNHCDLCTSPDIFSNFLTIKKLIDGTIDNIDLKHYSPDQAPPPTPVTLLRPLFGPIKQMNSKKGSTSAPAVSAA